MWRGEAQGKVEWQIMPACSMVENLALATDNLSGSRWRLWQKRSQETLGAGRRYTSEWRGGLNVERWTLAGMRITKWQENLERSCWRPSDWPRPTEDCDGGENPPRGLEQIPEPTGTSSLSYWNQNLKKWFWNQNTRQKNHLQWEAWHHRRRMRLELEKQKKRLWSPQKPAGR